MSSLTVPFFPSASFLAHQPTMAASAQVLPCRGILAIEPDIAVLRENSLLLTQANYCVTQATGDGELFHLRGLKAIALAILSDRLGLRLLRTVGEVVRRQWPRARILIVGQAPAVLEDHLYDEQIHRSADPQQVLADLEILYRGMWNQRSNTLDWNANRSARSVARLPLDESDPTKTTEPAPMLDLSLRDRPSDIRLPALRHA